MTAPRTLTKPPITEALVDIRATVSQSTEEFERFARQFADRFPNLEVKQAIRAELRVEGGKLVPPQAELMGFQGIRMTNADGTLIVQFRPDGFTLNNLKTYVGGDRLISEGLEFWSAFRAHMKPSNVSRIAFRYINHLDLPIQRGDDFKTFMTSPADLPEPLNERVSEFLSRVVAHTSDTTHLIVTQRLSPNQEQRTILLLDIDVSETREFSGEAEELRLGFATLRNLRNQAFFSLLTERTVSLYV